MLECCLEHHGNGRLLHVSLHTNALHMAAAGMTDGSSKNLTRQNLISTVYRFSSVRNTRAALGTW